MLLQQQLQHIDCSALWHVPGHPIAWAPHCMLSNVSSKNVPDWCYCMQIPSAVHILHQYRKSTEPARDSKRFLEDPEEPQRKKKSSHADEAAGKPPCMRCCLMSPLLSPLLRELATGTLCGIVCSCPFGEACMQSGNDRVVYADRSKVHTNCHHVLMLCGF